VHVSVQNNQYKQAAAYAIIYALYMYVKVLNWHYKYIGLRNKTVLSRDSWTDLTCAEEEDRLIP
jgi:hypothetical protein